jgi:hypothetical protein
MATKPTRLQQQAGDKLAEALLLITEAARLDGGGKLDREGLGVIVERVSRVSSAFAPDDIVARALERRAKALGLPSDAAELLTLMESGIQPPAMLLLGDDDFKGLVERIREELGDV